MCGEKYAQQEHINVGNVSGKELDIHVSGLWSTIFMYSPRSLPDKQINMKKINQTNE